MAKLIRVLTYEGSSDWLSKIMRSNYVKGKVQFLPGMKITETFEVGWKVLWFTQARALLGVSILLYILGFFTGMLYEWRFH